MPYLYDSWSFMPGSTDLSNINQSELNIPSQYGPNPSSVPWCAWLSFHASEVRLCSCVDSTSCAFWRASSKGPGATSMAMTRAPAPHPIPPGRPAVWRVRTSTTRLHHITSLHAVSRHMGHWDKIERTDMDCLGKCRHWREGIGMVPLDPGYMFKLPAVTKQCHSSLETTLPPDHCNHVSAATRIPVFQPQNSLPSAHSNIQ